MSDGFKGSCLCGSVRFESTSAPQIVGHCHCEDCQKSSGTGHCTHIMVPEDTFTVTGEVRFYDRPADSGSLVSQGFCPTCGSPLYSTNSAMEGVVVVRASVLDDPNVITPQLMVYAAQATDWDPPDRTLNVYDEMPDGGHGWAGLSGQLGRLKAPQEPIGAVPCH